MPITGLNSKTITKAKIIYLISSKEWKNKWTSYSYPTVFIINAANLAQLLLRGSIGLEKKIHFDLFGLLKFTFLRNMIKLHCSYKVIFFSGDFIKLVIYQGNNFYFSGFFQIVKLLRACLLNKGKFSYVFYFCCIT
jgi:hypothetical protein